MKIFVYYSEDTGDTSCYPNLQDDSEEELLYAIEAVETDLPLTDNWEGIGIEIGEIFSCNHLVANLIRIA